MEISYHGYGSTRSEEGKDTRSSRIMADIIIPSTGKKILVKIYENTLIIQKMKHGLEKKVEHKWY